MINKKSRVVEMRWIKNTFMIVNTFALMIFCISCEEEEESEAEIVNFSMTFGGSNYEYGNSVKQTSDEGYVIAGYTFSVGEGRDTWLIKTDAFGNEEWNRSLGWDGYAYSVETTTDGGYIIAGAQKSDSVFAKVVKTDPYGHRQWLKTYNGSGSSSWCESVRQTADDGYIIGANNSNNDAWLIKTDGSGDEEWSRTFDIEHQYGEGHEDTKSVLQHNDGGYIIGGNSYSFAENIVFLIKTDGFGNEEWRKIFPGYTSPIEFCKLIEHTSDGGYIITGGKGGEGAIIVKTDESGNIEWSESLGVQGSGRAYCAQETSDGGYIITGSIGYYTTGSAVWLIKTDSDGKEIWSKIFGGSVLAGESGGDVGEWVVETNDGGYVIVGYTYSYGAGNTDVWLIKTDSEGNTDLP